MKKLQAENKINDFIKYLQIEEKSNATIDKYSRDIRLFLSWNHEEKITKNTVIQFKEHLLRIYKPRSINSIIASLSSFFKYLNQYDLIIKPLKIQQQPFRNKCLHITKAECQKMISQTTDLQTKVLIKTLANSGIRVSELKYLTVESVQQNECTIYSKGKIRVIYIPNHLRKELLDYCKKQTIEQGSIFVNKEGKPLNRVTIWRKIKKAAKISDIPETKAFPHNFRHLYAVTFYQKNKDVNLLASLLGHSNINTTRIYLQEDELSCFQKVEQVFSDRNII